MNVTDFGDFAPGTYTLIDFSGATTSTLSAGNFVLGNTLAGYDFSLALTSSARPHRHERGP